MNIALPHHPLLQAITFGTVFPKSVGLLSYPQQILDCLENDFSAPVQTDESIQKAIRDLLRYGGYKPAGRGKPSSEYLLRSYQESSFPKVNLAVDIGNIVSLYSGIPVSVVDLSRMTEPFSINLARQGESYQFNPSGQTIDISGLPCLYDASGACANAVKDSQRTKTDIFTTQTLSVIWGSTAIKDQLIKTHHWFLQLLSFCDAAVYEIPGQ